MKEDTDNKDCHEIAERIEAAAENIKRPAFERELEFLDEYSAVIEKLMVRDLSLRQFAEVLTTASGKKVSYWNLRHYLKKHFAVQYEKYYTARKPVAVKKSSIEITPQKQKKENKTVGSNKPAKEKKQEKIIEQKADSDVVAQSLKAMLEDKVKTSNEIEKFGEEL